MDEVPAGTSLEVPPTGLTSRQVRARRRRRRRRFGVLVFLLVAAGVFAAAYLTLASPNDSADSTGTAVTTLAPTTTVAKAFGPYKVTTGVNVRQGAGTNFTSVGTVETGRTVFVACVVEGQPVDGPSGPDPRWLRLTGFGPNGYVTALYVSTGDDLTNNKIPKCPSA